MSSIRAATRFVNTFIALALCLAPALAAGDVLSPKKVTALILRERPAVKDAAGWAADMLTAFADIKIPASRENICAGIAIISQESGFSANPAVADLGRISEQALRDKLDGLPILGAKVLDYLEQTPTPGDSVMDRIRAARTERDLDLVYRGIVDEIGARTELQLVLQSGILNRLIEQRNEISTIGSMQVSVAFALATERQRRWTPMSLQDTYQVRDMLYTRKGGMTFGLLQLLGYDSGYDRKVHRFADYNAGRYASRNAAFQSVIAQVGGVRLARDGDLLAYTGGGKPSAKPGETEKALRAIAATNNLPLKEEDIRRDLKHEKSKGFTATQTYRLLRDLYRRKTGRPPPFAAIPDIALNSAKIASRMTTRIFAERVNGRYQRCMKEP